MLHALKRRVGTVLLSVGFDPRRALASIRFLPQFIWNLKTYLWQADDNAVIGPLALVPVLSDRYMPGGVARGHYFHQDLWAARRIYSNNPRQHVDIGSRVDGFIAHLLSFRSVVVIDIRPIVSDIVGLEFRQGDITKVETLGGFNVDSVSCLHSIEHFGLGRYGDPIDKSGWLKGLENLAQMTAAGGRLYLSAPIGRPVVEFNAQRIFAPRQIPEAAAKMGLSLLEFSYVDDAGIFHEFASLADPACGFGCGCYVFERKASV